MESTDVELYFEKKLTKNDKNFLKFLLKYYEKYREEFIEVDKNKIFKILKISDADLGSYFDRFMKKKIYYSIKGEDGYIGKGSFHIISSYFIQKEGVVFVLSKEILLSFDKNNFFNRINLNSILSFENSNSVHLYLKFLKQPEYKGNIEFSLNELREIFEVGDSYDRFYDFERNVIKPIIDDLNRFSEYEVDYSKLKSGPSQSCKVIGIEISFVNKFVEEMREKANYLMGLVKDEVKDFDLVYKTLFENLARNEYNYVYNNLIFAKESYEENFYEFLVKALNEDLYGIVHEKEEENKIVIEKKVKNIYSLHEEVNKVLLKIDSSELLNPNFLGPTFYRDLHSLKDGETFSFRNDFIKIEIYYNKKDKSTIKICILKK